MKVKELIQNLKKLNQEMDVLIEYDFTDSDDGYDIWQDDIETIRQDRIKAYVKDEYVIISSI